MRVRIPALLAAGAMFALPTWAGTLTFEDRVAVQRAIENVYWQHRLWPSENPARKPSIDSVMSRATLESRVQTYLRKSNALATIWHRPITREQLQAELDRMVRDTRDPKLLRELFDALGNDADLIAETLARPILAERLIRSWSTAEAPDAFDAWWSERKNEIAPDVDVVAHGLTLPDLSVSSCTNDTWKSTHTELPDSRMYHYAVWTGTEMIVWGGAAAGPMLRSGGRYNPATDAWVAIATAPPAGVTFGPGIGATVVWTGTEMIVWGGCCGSTNTGARYNPTNDTWALTSMGANVPAPRGAHTAVWTGSLMIVWGGFTANEPDSSIAGRYDPSTDKWLPPASTLNAPGWRTGHTAVWTGSEMLVWGGTDGNGIGVNTGARYDPVADTWSPIGAGANAPAARRDHAAHWTGSAMVVWGGRPDTSTSNYLNSGGRFDPVTSTWLPMSQGADVPSPRSEHTTVWTGSKMIVFGGNVPDVAPHAYDPSADTWQSLAASPLGKRYRHTAVWTGTEMIVWGGRGTSASPPFNTGARYNPQNDSWVMTSMGGVPAEREATGAVWTGTEMIVWGGSSWISTNGNVLSSGGKYTPVTDSWVPTSMTNAPSARETHAAVWTGTEMVVWGGRSTVALNSGGRYNPNTDTWRSTSVGANVPSPRTRPLVVWSGKEMIVAGDATFTGGRYDPVADSWRTTAVGPAMGGDGQTAVWSGTEMIVFQGGFGTAGRYNPVTDSWTAVPPAPLSNRIEESSVWTGTEMIVWGGNSSNTGARYNPVTNAWTLTSTGANVGPGRSAHTATWTGSEMLIWGGINSDSSQNPTRGSRYDPLTDSWQLMSMGADQPGVRAHHAAVWTGSQLIIWSGGDPPTATGGVYCACPDGRIVYRDADGDGYGDARTTAPRCDGIVPAGYSVNAIDCNDAVNAVHPGALETCNAIDDDCDGLVDELHAVEDSDGDALHDACDDCASTFNPTQSDLDDDGEGDACDVNDGTVFLYGPSGHERLEWQEESGPTSWNVYQGDLAVLRSTGIYAQAHSCGILGTSIDDPLAPPAGTTRFTLVTGVTSGLEGSLGANSAGTERPNSNPCP